MSGQIEARLATLGIRLPDAPAAAGNYAPWVQVGDLVFVSGQIGIQDGKPACLGRLGHDLGVEEGYAAARLCGINLLTQLKAACGDLDRVRRVVRLGGFVNSTPDFVDQPKVINGASDLMVEVFGDKGRHARAAVGSCTLPLGVAVEVEGLFQVE